MKNEIDQTVERIGQLPDGENLHWWDKESQTWLPEPEDALLSDELKDLRTAYTQLKADLATARQGLEHYADTYQWLCCQPSYLHDCKTDKCWMTNYDGDGQGWEHAQQTLDAIGKE